MVRLIILVCFVAQISSISYAQRKRDIDVFDLYYAFGLGEMKDLRMFGYDWYFAHGIGDSRFKLTGRYAIGTTPYSYAAHDLPMVSNDIGNYDSMRVTNGSMFNKFGLGLRYSPMEFYEWSAPIVPYFQIGFGVINFRQKWNTRNVPIRPLDSYGDPDYDWERKIYRVKGAIHQNWTWYGSVSVGAIIPYGNICMCEFFGLNCDTYFGFAIDYEFGGRLKYTDPDKKSHHFYYESGLGEEQNRPFVDWANADQLSFYKVARYQMLALRLTFLRFEF